MLGAGTTYDGVDSMRSGCEEVAGGAVMGGCDIGASGTLASGAGGGTKGVAVVPVPGAINERES